MHKLICYTLTLVSLSSPFTAWAEDLSDLDEVSIKVIGLDAKESQDVEIIEMPDPNFEQFKKITPTEIGNSDLQGGNEIITTTPTPNN